MPGQSPPPHRYRRGHEQPGNAAVRQPAHPPGAAGQGGDGQTVDARRCHEVRLSASRRPKRAADEISAINRARPVHEKPAGATGPEGAGGPPWGATACLPPRTLRSSRRPIRPASPARQRRAYARGGRAPRDAPARNIDGRCGTIKYPNPACLCPPGQTGTALSNRRSGKCDSGERNMIRLYQDRSSVRAPPPSRNRSGP